MMPGKAHVEWLNPAAPGSDSTWEMQLYGLVRTGQNEPQPVEEGPQQVEEGGLRAEVERPGAENTSMRIHLGVSDRSTLAPAW